MKKIILFLIILSLAPNLVHAANYGAEEYGCGLFGIGCSAAPTAPSSGGGGGTTIITYECSQDSDCGKNEYCSNHTCYDIECFDNNDCKEDESCLNYRCVKLFDMEILEFESPVKIGDFFDFTYFLKAVAEINGDVEIKFWIEQDGNVVTSGQDTIYFSSFEEKTKTKKLFLPDDISSGTYIFYIEVTYGAYTASAHRTIGIEVKEGMATIRMSPDFTQYMIYGLIGLGIFIVFLIFYLEKRKIKAKLKENNRLREIVTENKGEDNKSKTSENKIINKKGYATKYISELINKKVYTDSGYYVGKIKEIILGQNKIDSLKIKLDKKWKFKIKGIILKYNNIESIGQVVIINSAILEKIDSLKV